MAKKIILGYARESTLSQAMYGFNLDEQVRRIESYFNAIYDSKEYVLTIVREEGYSAKSLRRPRMAEIIKDIKKRKVHGVITYSLDRISRNVRDASFLMELFENYGVEFCCISENFSTKSPSGKFTGHLLAALAQLEIENISERTKRGLLESARQGNYCISRLPFGYKRDPNDCHKIIPDEERAEIVRYMFKKVGEDKWTPYQLRLDLNSRKVGGLKWYDKKIYKILKNNIYYGLFIYAGIRFKNHVPAIISEELFFLCREQMKSKSYDVKRSYLFKDYVYCSNCKNKANHSTTLKNKSQAYPYYVCPQCKQMIGEKRLLQTVHNEFTHILQECEYNDILKKLSNQYKKLDVESLRLKHFCLDFNVDISETGSSIESEKKEVIEFLSEQIRKIRKLNFAKLADIEKQQFLLRFVTRVDVCMKSKHVFVTYKLDNNFTFI